MNRLRSISPRGWAALAAVLAAGVALVVFLSVMRDEDFRRTGTNSLVVPTHSEVPSGEEICEDGQFVPAGSRAVAPWVGGPNGADGGPVEVTVIGGGRRVAEGRSADRFPTGINPMALDRTIDRDIHDATVCFENRDPAGLLFVYGDFPPPGYPTNNPALPRIDWYGEKPQSWWDTLPAIARRFPLVKAGFMGPWTFWLAMASLAGLGVAAVSRVVREAQA